MATFTQIGSAVTVGSGGAATIDFSSIPSTFTDLILKISARVTTATDFNSITVAFNGNATGFASRIVQGDGSGVVSATLTTFVGGVGGTLLTASTFNSVEIYIPNYAGSTNKSYSFDSVVENNAIATRIALGAGLRSNTAAVNQVTLTPSSGNFAEHSTAYLYGVSNA
jgi:hypothetical protein